MTPDLLLAPELSWYVARSTGIVAWALVSISVIIGLVQSTRTYSTKPGPAWLRAFHGYAGLLAIVLTLVHMIGLLVDTYVDFDVADLFIPFASDWEPAAVAWGVLGFYLLLAVEATAVFAKRLRRGMWLKVHRLSALTYVLTTAHLLTAGTDRTSPWLMAAVLATIAMCGSLLLTRVALSSRVARS